MSKPRLGKTPDNKDMHYSVGAIIKRDNQYFTIERRKFPLGFAFIAGHIDEQDFYEADENLPKAGEIAIRREVAEESGHGFRVLDLEKIAEEMIPWNKCSRGISAHYWQVYVVEVQGEVKPKPDEVKSFSWKTSEELRKLSEEQKLEPVWDYFLKKLKII